MREGHALRNHGEHLQVAGYAARLARASILFLRQFVGVFSPIFGYVDQLYHLLCRRFKICVQGTVISFPFFAVFELVDPIPEQVQGCRQTGPRFRFAVSEYHLPPELARRVMVPSALEIRDGVA